MKKLFFLSDAKKHVDLGDPLLYYYLNIYERFLGFIDCSIIAITHRSIRHKLTWVAVVDGERYRQALG